MFANDGFKIRGWNETGLHVSSRHAHYLECRRGPEASRGECRSPML